MLLEGEDLTVDQRQADGAHRRRPEAGQRAVAAPRRRLRRSARTATRQSQIGTPGLVEALRQRLGHAGQCARLRHPRDPRLPRLPAAHLRKRCSARSWRCPTSPPGGAGRRAERDHVHRQHRPHDDRPGLSTRLPFEDDNGDRARLARCPAEARQRCSTGCEADGGDFVGQEAVTLSTTPVYVDGRLEPRPMTLRVYAGPHPDGWRSCRAASPASAPRSTPPPSPCSAAARRPTSGSSASKPVERETLLPREDDSFTAQVPGSLPSRAADNLFWLGRYVERCGRRRCASCAPITRGLPRAADPDHAAARRHRATISSRIGIDADARRCPPGLLRDIDSARLQRQPDPRPLLARRLAGAERSVEDRAPLSRHA